MATVKFYLKESAKGTGEASIQLKFTIDRRNRFALATGEKINPKFWNTVKQEAKSNYPGHLEFNQSLTNIRKDIIQLYRDNKSDEIDALKEKSRPLIKFGKATAPEKKSLYPTLSLFIKWCKKERDKKTAQKYQALSNHLTGFNPKLSLEDLSLDFYDLFKDFLYKKEHFDSTVYKYLANLHTFLNWADTRGHKIHLTKGKPTHALIEIIERKPSPISLTKPELESLESMIITEELIMEKLPPAKHGRRGARSIKALTIARDYLVMECRTGQRISDLKAFDPSQLEGMVWNNHVTKGARLSGKVIRIPFNTIFTAPAYAILQKYDFKLPKISEKTLNENIKAVCKLAGIDKSTTVIKWRRNEKVIITKPKHDWISTHTGRKTFITIALQYLPPKLVKDIAGISWETLKHYEGQSEDQVLIDGLNLIPQLKIAL